MATTTIPSIPIIYEHRINVCLVCHRDAVANTSNCLIILQEPMHKYFYWLHRDCFRHYAGAEFNDVFTRKTYDVYMNGIGWDHYIGSEYRNPYP